MAGIQVRKEASGNVHVTWIPALHAGMTVSKGLKLEVTEVPPPAYF
jgi:hypothetical protein